MRSRQAERCTGHGEERRCRREPAQLHLAAESIEALAQRLAQVLRPAPATSSGRRLVSTAEIARLWSVERSWVYAHAKELGARQLGTGKRPRLRFDPEEVSERIAEFGRPKYRRERLQRPQIRVPRRDSLPERSRAIVGGHDRVAGRRANAPGPAPKK